MHIWFASIFLAISLFSVIAALDQGHSALQYHGLLAKYPYDEHAAASYSQYLRNTLIFCGLSTLIIPGIYLYLRTFRARPRRPLLHLAVSLGFLIAVIPNILMAALLYLPSRLLHKLHEPLHLVEIMSRYFELPTAVFGVSLFGTEPFPFPYGLIGLAVSMLLYSTISMLLALIVHWFARTISRRHLKKTGDT